MHLPGAGTDFKNMPQKKKYENQHVTVDRYLSGNFYIHTAIVGFVLVFLVITETNAQKYLTSFGRVTNVKTNGYYTKILSGDFNGDGRSDLATVNQNEIHLFLQSRNGISFTEKSIRLSANIHTVATGLVNNDKITDFIIIIDNPYSLVVYIGAPDGHYSVSWKRTLIEPSDNILVADITNDRKMDIILYGKRELGATVYPGTGTGTFRQNITLFSEYSFTAFAVTKSNTDALNDVVAANWISNQILTYTAFGKLSFSDPTVLHCDATPQYILTGQIDQDNNNDFIVGYSDAHACDVFMGDGLGAYIRSTTIPLAGGINALALQDVNDDGRTDVLILSAATLFVRLNNGNGLFEEETPFYAGVTPSNFTLFPSQRSNINTLAILDTASSVIRILHPANERSLGGEAQAYAVGNRPTGILCTDINRDGSTDVIVANEGSQTISILLGTNGNSYQGQIAIRTAQIPSQLRYYSLNDTLAVITSVNDYSNDISVLEIHRKTFSSRLYTLPTQGQPNVLAFTHERNSLRFTILAIERDIAKDIASIITFEKISGNRFTQQVSTLNGGLGRYLDAAYSSDGNMTITYAIHDPNQKTETIYRAGYTQSCQFSPSKTICSYPLNRKVPMFVWAEDVSNDRQADIIYYLGEPENKLFMMTAKNDTSFTQPRLITTASTIINAKSDLQVFDCDSNGKTDIVFPDKLRKNLRICSVNDVRSTPRVVPVGQTIDHYAIARFKNEFPCNLVVTDSQHGIVIIQPLTIE
jgi:hypothetical protein